MSGFWLSGIDEAGYGPVLGPLVVGMTTLRAEAGVAPAAPWKLLSPTVVRRATRRRAIRVADSKLLHRPQADDLSGLELGVLSFVTVERGGEPPASFRELLDHLTAGRSSYLDAYPWYRDVDLPLPYSVDRLELLGAARRLGRALGRAGLAVAEVRALPLEVTEFNSNLGRRASKGEVNAWAFGRFLAWLWRQQERLSCEVRADRLGGRLRYGPFLYPLFRGAEFQILHQGHDEQAYQARTPDRTLTVHFHKEGEDKAFPTALASMTAKYVRELHMTLLNRWWLAHEASLRPTAGYPTDAHRFLNDIAPLRKRLGIDDALLIRTR